MLSWIPPQVEPELSAAAASIVDRFFGMDYEDESEEDGDGELGTGTKGAAAHGREELREPIDEVQGPRGHGMMPGQCASGLGRGAHLTRPAWMQNAP